MDIAQVYFELWSSKNEKIARYCGALLCPEPHFKIMWLTRKKRQRSEN